jgi:probable HAF family extracellular repeat protein
MGINNQGQVVGYSGLVFGITHAFQWENGNMIDLGTLPGHNGRIAYDTAYSSFMNTPQKPGFFTVLASLLILFKKPGFFVLHLKSSCFVVKWSDNRSR